MEYPELAPGVDSETAGVVRGYCRWHIAPVVTETLVLPSSGSSSIILPTLKLRAVTALTIDGTALTSDELADLNWYQAGYIRTGRRIPCKGRAISVTITHGFEECPIEILAAVTRIDAGVPYAGLKSAATLSNSFSTAAGDTDDGFDPYVSRILGDYRVPIGS